MIKALIIDDEPKARSVLHQFIISFVPEITEARMAASVEEARGILQVFKPDLVFLDVEMPHQNGFDFLLLPNMPDFDVIFTTAYNQYAIQAIRFSALDFLLKPISPEDLRAAVKRHFSKGESFRQRKLLFDNLAANIDKRDVKDFRLAVPSSEGVFFFMIHEILRLEADRNYTIIHLIGKRPFIASKTLKHFEDMLIKFRFVRTHKSHLVNLDHIIRISNNNEFIILSDGSRIEVSRRKKDEVQRQLNIH
ncbi:LytTR family DNA-binding domain-containing protein [Dyadobacter sp. CY261]|uniref:LytR/AlgR family response regulator transcription factor n=1 Tax=Dyadobacter sp. CY261 TaxID=2907203 RepID=UPI001F3CFD74|nr:LytTR family DNA-binding domain-containing protein [Dyadobacter sp. CY261]MCF0070993.1 LytTR family DNA-binding domain-containing protein [Dyadobacter sp. CY261]